MSNVRNHPDFIIAGAQKAGTTTLHFLLDLHQDISMVDGEVNYWSEGDANERAAYEPCRRFPVTTRSPSSYHELFSRADRNKLIGEDSTTYLSSEVATQALAKEMPEVKFIFLLRNPISRTYSHYWHQMLTGRAFLTFEKWLNREPNLIRRSLYGSHLSRYFNCFDRSQIKVLIFEELINDPHRILDDICAFLAVAPYEEAADRRAHKNKSELRRNRRLWMLQNRVQCSLPGWALNKKLARLLARAHDRFNPLIDDKYPPMDPATNSRLTDVFAPDVIKLNDLLGTTKAAETWGFPPHLQRAL